MNATTFANFGRPEVLEIIKKPDPQPGPSDAVRRGHPRHEQSRLGISNKRTPDAYQMK